MKMLKQILLVFGVLATTGTTAFAHSGEHSMSLMEGMRHFLANPTHFWPIVGIAIVAIGFTLYRAQSSRKHTSLISILHSRTK